jgi:hypothetical protein
MNKANLLEFKQGMEATFREVLNEKIKELGKIVDDDITSEMILYSTASNFSSEIRKNYQFFKKEYEDINEKFDLTEQEYDQVVDEITKKILAEYFKIPKNTNEDFNF